jgi:hypothetical protein
MMKVEIDTRPDDLTEAWRIVDKVRAGTPTVKMPVTLIKALLLDHSRMAKALGESRLQYSQCSTS